MAALVVALAILMWLWGAVGLHLVRRYGGNAEATIRMAYLVVVLALGAVPLAAVAYLILPASVLSQGWTREYLESAQQAATVAVLVSAAASFLRSRAALAGVRHPVARAPVKPK